jgi:hypothetical protein
MSVERAFVDLAQPRYVGPGYWTASERRLFLMINPGAGDGSPSDAAMRQDIRDYSVGKIGLDDLFRRQRGSIPTWRRGKLLSFIEENGALLDEIALLNIAWCAVKGNKYTPEMLQACWTRFTRLAIEALAPTLVVACGEIPKKFAKSAGIPFVAAPHFAARGPRAPDLRVIRLGVNSNPKKRNSASAARYACYSDGMTVADYRAEVDRRLGPSEAAKCRADIRHDTAKNFIRVEPR